MITEKKVILPTDEGILEKVNMDIWKTSDGRLFVKENAAREHACTHKICGCGEIMKKYNFCCESCSAKKNGDRYLKMPEKEWDLTTPLCLYDDDKFFYDEEDIDSYCDENDCKPEELRLVICSPNYLRQVDEDYFCDELPEDGDLPKEFTTKLAELNRYIESLKPISWSPGPFRTNYKG